jgi:hypothetical protein
MLFSFGGKEGKRESTLRKKIASLNSRSGPRELGNLVYLILRCHCVEEIRGCDVTAFVSLGEDY